VADVYRRVLAEPPQPDTDLLKFYRTHPDEIYAEPLQRERVRWLKSKGIKMTGTEVSVRLRPELYGKPRFDKLIGPMYNGPKGIRYETQESYDESSR
jgi:hypothetical protein